jgi:glucosyl-3-phosphoglycerate synthase
MGDFYQTGILSTFHRLGNFNLARMEQELEEIAQLRGITLVLPSLYSELQREALRNILEDLKEINYLREIIVTLGPTSEEEFSNAREFFSALPQSTTLIWNSGPRVEALFEEMRKMQLDPGPDGKGRSAWMAYGYVIASGQSEVIALHDCDIVTYSRELLGRLVYPVASYRLNYEFCKGYYSRVTNRMHGRVTRLFVTPLVRALMKMLGHLEILRYYDSFRYILAGEFCMQANVALINRIPADWGLEVGMLSEVYRNCALKRICQSEICENYEHKHQELSPEDKDRGLNKMAIDIAKTIFRTLAGQGVVYTPGFFNTLRTTYLKEAQDCIDRFMGDALLNGLTYDRHEEAIAIEVFIEAIQTAGEIIANDPLGPPLIPNWNRVFSAIPDFGSRLIESIKKDNE